MAKAAGRVKLRIADATPEAGSATRVIVRVTTIPSTVEVGGRVKVLVDGKVVRRLRLADGRATLKIAFPAGTHKVVAKHLGSSTVSVAVADRQVRARH